MSGEKMDLDFLKFVAPKITQDGTGAESSMRWGFVTVVPLGAVVVLAGVVAMFQTNPAAIPAMGIGAGLIGLAFGGKAWQAQAEAKVGAL